MKNVICTLASILFLSSIFISCSKDSIPVVAQTEKQFSAEIQTKLDAALNKTILEHHIPGVIAGIWSTEGTWVKTKGMGNLETNEIMNSGNHFRIGSVTKTFVGTVVLKLVDSGKISLDSSLAFYLPQYAFPNANKITIRMLGNMTSGIYDITNDANYYLSSYLNYNGLVTFTADSLIKAALQFPLKFDPGTAYSYSNINTDLLGLICEKVTDKSIDQLLQEMIFTPYGLNNTYWPKTIFLPEPFSHGYSLVTTPIREMKDVTFYSPSIWNAAGILVSNLEDLKKWAKLMGTGALYSSAMHAERIKWTVESGNMYGFTLFDAGAGWIGHNGSIPGFTTSCFYLPSKDAVIIVHVNSNIKVSASSDTPADAVFYALAEILTPQTAFAKNKIQTLDQNIFPIEKK